MVIDMELNAAFNTGQVNNQSTQMSSDRELIERLGGPTKVAELLNYPKHGGAQRVQNWIIRGIPSRVRLEHPDIFLSESFKKAA